MKLCLALLLLVAAIPVAAQENNQCCNKPCGESGNECYSYRDLAFQWWCDAGYDCKNYVGPGPNQNWCCGLVPFVGTPEELRQQCSNPASSSHCRDIEAMVKDPAYFATVNPSTFLTAEDICTTEGFYGPYLCYEPPPGDGFAGGEPHFKTWNGTWYDYHGECDLVLMDAPDVAEGLGLKVHIRTKARYDYSFIEAASLLIGDDVLEVASWGEYWLNGVESADLPGTLSDLYAVTHEQRSDKEHSFTVQLSQESDEKVLINVFKDMVSIKFENASSQGFGSSKGLLGTFGEGVPMGRDGTVFALDENPGLFAEHWQVQPADPKLFDTIRAPQAPAKCILPDPAKAAARRRLGEKVAMETAEAACAHWEHKAACLYDVMATGDLDLAKSTPY